MDFFSLHSDNYAWLTENQFIILIDYMIFLSKFLDLNVYVYFLGNSQGWNKLKASEKLNFGSRLYIFQYEKSYDQNLDIK